MQKIKCNNIKDIVGFRPLIFHGLRAVCLGIVVGFGPLSCMKARPFSSENQGGPREPIWRLAGPACWACLGAWPFVAVHQNGRLTLPLARYKNSGQTLALKSLPHSFPHSLIFRTSTERSEEGRSRHLPPGRAGPTPAPPPCSRVGGALCPR